MRVRPLYRIVTPRYSRLVSLLFSAYLLIRLLAILPLLPEYFALPEYFTLEKPSHLFKKIWETQVDGKITVPFDTEGNILVADGSRNPRHPIHELVKKAENRWEALRRRQSRSLCEAVHEYQRRYGRLPPKGFDTWYDMAIQNSVVLIDEINRDIAPFLAISPSAAMERISNARKHHDTYRINVVDGKTEIVGRRRADMADLLSDIAPLLPNLTLHLSIHDMGAHVFGDDFRVEVDRALTQGRYEISHFESMKRNPRTTHSKACFDNAPAILREANITRRDSLDRSFRFIDDHLATMDFCNNPDILDNNGIFLYNRSRKSSIMPLFVQCKLRQGGDILHPSLARYKNFDKVEMIPWSKRTKSKLFWRGRMTGSFHNKRPDWRKSHRVRLHNVAHNVILGENRVDLLVEDSRGRLSRRTYTRKDLNDAYLDVGLIGPAMQCAKHDGVCDDITREIDFVGPVWGDVGRNKYVLDVDGNGWSARYQGLLGSGSLVLKATVFPEWNSDWLVPYYHYVPVQHDYSDLYNVMAFFAGSPDGQGGHEDIAKKIGEHGAEFVRHHWRWVDMQVYMYRLLLEYNRAMSADREAMTYRPESQCALRR
ncbi:F-actin-capping protein subunit alpha [Tulasnella sp. 403]|nr:F-actin-capping protein subunit alpha [Tulasnella sp. 403]